MSCGLPIIATSVAGCTADLVEPGRNGLIIPPSDVARLASAMTLLACDPELRKSMGAHSSEKIGQFSPEACADALARAASLVSGSARYV
jgi:glycosyltransferase involved in cell wall biosynthesis